MSHAPSTTAKNIMKFFRLFSDLLTVKNVVLLAALALVALTGFFGGWEPATTEGTLALEEGDTAQADPLAITAGEALWTSDPGPLGFANPENVYLLLRAHVDSSHAEAIPAPIVQRAVTGFLSEPLEAQPGLWSNSYVDDGSLGTPNIYRVIDDHRARGVQPNLPQEYWFVWELPATTPAEATVEFHFFSHTWRKSSLEDTHIWADRTLAATQVLTAQVLIAEGAE